MKDNITSDAGTWIELSFSDRPKARLGLTALLWRISEAEELVLKNKLVIVLGKKKCLKNYNQYIICVSSDVRFQVVRIYQFILTTNLIL